ncbi:MAG: hypothetical protein NTW12_13005 [Deltaproteobacteria bacterium]|nr:hypothetical protein [Deltaproteobacteria bacterium]
MKRLLILLALSLLILISACASRITTTQPTTPSVHYIPIQYEVTYAQGVNAPDNLLPLIKKKIQEYLDDKGWWETDSKSVRLSIKITKVETASAAATVFIGPLAPPGKISGEVVIYYEDKIVGQYTIDSSYRTVSGVALFSDLDDRIAGKFVSEVMYAVRQ